MPIKVPQHIVDNDVLVYGVCYIEKDHMGNERRIDPLRLIITSGLSRNAISQRSLPATLKLPTQDPLDEPIDINHLIKRDRYLTEQVQDMLDKEMEKINEPVCTCRDDDKYARPLCPVCDKERYDEMTNAKQSLSTSVIDEKTRKEWNEQMQPDWKDYQEKQKQYLQKPVDMSAEEFFKSIKGDI